jgi:hypothetical protein
MANGKWPVADGNNGGHTRYAIRYLPIAICYNSTVPTPFNHLVLARQLLNSSGLSPAVCAALAAEWPAFLFGNIAPDAQTVSGQPREATHFFPVPLGDAPPAHEALFARHPELARPDHLPPARAAFLSGYLAHLELDQLWISDIFDPVFGPRQTWGNFRERLYLHNVFRAHWDAQDLPRLPLSTGDGLRAARPANWLPFVGDGHLQRWRDLVADQLAPGAAARTVEVFARRMGADPAAFAALVNSPAEMERRVFARVAPARLAQFCADGLARCAERIHAYFNP